jgi:hypothetical protein
MPGNHAPQAHNFTLPKTLFASSVEDARLWDDLVSKSPTPDTYYRSGYAAAYGGEHAEALSLILQTSTRRFLIPLLLRKIALPFAPDVEGFDALTPYGYGGVLPLDVGAISHEEGSELVENLRQWCLKANVVSCMLRLHPLLAQEEGFRYISRDCMSGTLRQYGPTEAIDLTGWDDALDTPAGMSTNRHRSLRFARRHLSVTLLPCNKPEGLKLLRQFRPIYEETMRRVNASAFYFFPEEYFLSLAHALGSDMAIAVAHRGDQAVSGALLFADAQFGHYHLGGATSDGNRYKAQTLVLVEAANWMRNRGCRWFHLGGGRTPGDSLHYFKRSFGSSTFSYSYVTLIANRERYSDLLKLRKMQSDLGPSREEFFPEYRS